MSEPGAGARTPTVYFIDDSATMREVIKIAFRKENIHVVTCADAASAMAQFADAPPDAVITDVIMPDKDGYEVCQFIKEHAKFGRIPVILMSGVVNKAVAEKAMAVRADELVRKPFQPQELIARVKNLLAPKRSVVSVPDNASVDPSANRSSANALANLFGPKSTTAPSTASRFGTPSATMAVHSTAAPVATIPSPAARVPQTSTSTSTELTKLRAEIVRLELLVKKLEASLAAERQYSAALESHLKALQES